MSFIYFILVLISIGLLLYTTYKIFKDKDQIPKGNYPLPIKYKLYISQKWGEFLSLNVALILFTFGLTGFLLTLKQEETKQIVEAYNNLSKKAIVLYPNGKIANLYLNDLKPKPLKVYLDEIVLNYFVWGQSCLFKGEDFPENYLQIPNFCDKVKRLLNLNLFTTKGLGEYGVYYLQAIFTLAKQGLFPFFVKPLSISSEIKISKQMLKDGTIQLNFNYEANVNVEIMYVKNNQFFTGNSNFFINLNGFINPTLGDMQNPFGIKIDKIVKVVIPQVP